MQQHSGAPRTCGIIARIPDIGSVSDGCSTSHQTLVGQPASRAPFQKYLGMEQVCFSADTAMVILLCMLEAVATPFSSTVKQSAVSCQVPVLLCICACCCFSLDAL